MPQTLESEWIRQARNGDTTAFAKIYRMHVKFVFGFSLRMVNHQQDAEEAVQITFTKLYQNLSAFQGRSSLSTYLMRIARNVCFDLLKQRKSGMESFSDEMIQHAAVQPGEGWDLSAAIQKLPDRMRACFILFAVQGFSQAEISDIMEIETGTVKAMVFQARQKLRIFLDPEVSVK